MEPLLYHLYSGQLFFSAAAILLTAAVLVLSGALERRPVLRSIASVFALASIPAAALSGTPMPALQAAAGVAATLPFALFGIVAPTPRRLILSSTAIVATLALVAAELPWHLRSFPRPKPRRLIVIGDSLSSGGFGESTTWPQRLASESGAELVNLALPGETASTAARNQLPDMPPYRFGDCYVVAVGGNDMLDELPPEGFEASLDRILATAGAGGHRAVVMLELPIVPGEWRYGSIQRRLAKKHEVALVPKRVIAGMLLQRGSTYDGLHPTELGHARLAVAVRESLGW